MLHIYVPTIYYRRMPYRYTKREGDSQYFYVWNTARAGKSLFRTEQDYRHFVARLSRDDMPKSCKVIAYCLLRNQYHVVLTERQPGGIAKFMHKLNVAYAMYFNARYDADGKLFAGPYGDRQLQDLDDLAITVAQLHRAPLAFGLTPATYIWSSYRGYIKPQAEWLHKEPLREYFNVSDLAVAVDHFTATVVTAPLPYRPKP